MSVTSTIRQARRRAETKMIDTCTITRPGGPGTFDPDTGETVPAESTNIYTGRCWVTARQVGDQVPQVAGQAVSLFSYDLSVPLTATDVEVGDTVTITTANDPGEVGRRLTVDSVEAATAATRRRFICTHDQG